MQQPWRQPSSWWSFFDRMNWEMRWWKRFRKSGNREILAATWQGRLPCVHFVALFREDAWLIPPTQYCEPPQYTVTECEVWRLFIDFHSHCLRVLVHGELSQIKPRQTLLKAAALKAAEQTLDSFPVSKALLTFPRCFLVYLTKLSQVHVLFTAERITIWKLI
jgi:hypothetical protein